MINDMELIGGHEPSIKTISCIKSFRSSTSSRMDVRDTSVVQCSNNDLIASPIIVSVFRSTE